MIKIILWVMGIAVTIVLTLGLRGQLSKNRPWHLFWDMKYQPKYTSQSLSPFFTDNRSMRLPVERTLAYTVPGYYSDAGMLDLPDDDVLQEDDVYYRGIAGPDIEIEIDVPKIGEGGKQILGSDKKPIMEKKKEMGKNWIQNIPRQAIQRSRPILSVSDKKLTESELELESWKGLIKRGQERFLIHCAVCHGESGYGGQGEIAHGIVGRYGMIGIANYHEDRIRNMRDGEIFNTITNGKNTMSSYAHQIKVQDRWAIVAYIRVLQLSQNAPVSWVPAEEREKWKKEILKKSPKE